MVRPSAHDIPFGPISMGMPTYRRYPFPKWRTSPRAFGGGGRRGHMIAPVRGGLGNGEVTRPSRDITYDVVKDIHITRGHLRR